MKILTGGILHESHSFSNVPTDLDVFRNILCLEGDEVIAKLRGTVSEMAGFIAGAERHGCELIPTVWANGLSSGPVTASALDYLLGSVKTAYQRAGKLDGVLFALHGAMVAEQSLDGDGYILERLRELVGADTPLVITLDLHANISERMVALADVIVGYDTYPHVDQVERGAEACTLLVRMLRGEIKPTMALSKPPLVVVPQKQLTGAEPMKALIARAHALEREVLSVTVAGGFAYPDVPEVGPGIVVVTDNDKELAQARANELADAMWQLREEFTPQLPSVEQAVSAAVTAERGPVILADVGDNIGAGTPGDGTIILRELIAQRADNALVILADKEAVAEAIAAGVGTTITLRVGGKCDEWHGEPLAVTGRVKLISDGVFTNRGHMRDGVVEQMGRTVVFATPGITLVLTEIKMPPWNLEQMRSIGIQPERMKIIAVKSAVAFRAAYEPIAARIIEVDSPGLSTLDLSRFTFRNLRRPLYPFDKH